MLKKILISIRRLFSNIATSDSGTEFIVYARAKLKEQNKLHASNWRLGKEQGWSANMRTGVIVFEFANGVTGTTHFQVIGTYNEIDKTFLWGWAHSAIAAEFKEHANLALQWGLENQHPSFIAKSLTCTLDDIWNFVAVANSLASSKGVYRGHAGTKYIFLTLGEMNIDTKAASRHWAAIVET